MASDRAKWLRDLARDDIQQRRLLDLPELLVRLSQDILARWDTLAGQGKRVERMRGLKLGVAAAQAAILLYGKPIRATNLRTLRIWCDEPNLVLPSGRARTVLLSIPGEEVKNGRPVEGELDPEAWAVLRFYLEEVRPRLIAAHPFGKNYADSVYLFPSPRRDRPMESSIFAAAFADAVRAAGLDMSLHLARHASVFFLLDEDPNAWAEAAELLGDTEMTVRKHYAFMCERKAHQAARAKLRRARAARLRGQF
jgi:integrase